MTLPVAQWAAFIFFLALESDLPLTFGTLQLTTGFGFSVWLKVAMTVFAASIPTVQLLLVTAQAPLQPANVEPFAATADSVTLESRSYSAVQEDPQSIAPVLLDTVPLPVPDLLTDRAKRVVAGVTAFDSGNAGTVPATFFAAILKVYVAPFVSPVMVVWSTPTVVVACATPPT